MTRYRPVPAPSVPGASAPMAGPVADRPSARAAVGDGHRAAAHRVGEVTGYGSEYEIRLDGEPVGRVISHGRSKWEIVGSADCTWQRPYRGTLSRVTGSVASAALP